MGHPSGTFYLFNCSRQQAEDAYSGGGLDIDFAVGDGGRHEFVAGAEMVAAVYGLVAVVDFGERRGIVGVEDGWIRVLGDPDDAIRSAVGGDTRRGSGIVEGMRGGRDRCRLKFRVFELEG